jgi:hypothetical protein
MLPSIFIGIPQNYGFKAVTPQIVSYLVERGYKVKYEFRIIYHFWIFIINFSRSAVPVHTLLILKTVLRTCYLHADVLIVYSQLSNCCPAIR